MSHNGDSKSSREGLLNSHSHSPRDSLDDIDDVSGSDIDLDELDATDRGLRSGLRGGSGSERLHRLRPRLFKGKGHSPNADEANEKPRRLPVKKRWVFTTAGLCLLGILALAILRIFYPHPPPHARSPPHYPSPRGGTVSTWKDSYAKASAMVSKMSLVEKVNITTGTGWATNLCVGNTGPATGVGFPMLCLQDGPLGVRFADHATVWPAGITLAATWSKDLMYKRGRGLGKEHRLKGVNVLLGPSMGPIGRMPAGGRNWEGFGPDPVLAGVAAAQTIRGIQEEGVMATAKHLVANEQEHFRQHGWLGVTRAISANIDDRTLHELYMWPFADSVRAGVASVMCSYNMINNTYACGNSKLLNGVLKDELGFQGFVQSDWLAQRSGVDSALAGLDMSMPGDGPDWNDRNPFWGPKLTEAVLNSSVPLERLNDMVTRIVAAWYQLKQDDNSTWPPAPPEGEGGPNFSSFTKEKMGRLHQDSGDGTIAEVNKFVDVQGTGDAFHGHLARTVAAEGMVLVKNDGGLLPLDRRGWTVKTRSEGRKFRVGIYGEDAGPNPDGPNACLDRACNVGTLAQGWGSGSAEFPFLSVPIDSLLSSFDNSTVETTSALTNKLPRSAVDDLEKQDVCLAFVNSDSGEEFRSWESVTDRNDLFPQKAGDELVRKVASKCARTVVIVHSVGPVVLEKWIDHPNVKAVIMAHLPGEVSGDALTDVLFGDVDASGRLPYTIGKSLSDYGPGGQVMYKPNDTPPQQNFSEGLLIDYRHFDAFNVTPRFEFGFGLSYTTFTFSDLVIKTLKAQSPLPSPRPSATIDPPSYSTEIPDSDDAEWPDDFPRIDRYIYPYLEEDISIGEYSYPKGYSDAEEPSPAGGGEGGNPSLYEDHVAASVDVTNVGNRRGQQVVQLYVSFPPTKDVQTNGDVSFPLRVLRGFEKIELDPGASKTVEINLSRRDLSYWSTNIGNWVMPDGEFKISVGASSKDLLLEAPWS